VRIVCVSLDVWQQWADRCVYQGWPDQLLRLPTSGAGAQITVGQGGEMLSIMLGGWWCRGARA